MVGNEGGARGRRTGLAVFPGLLTRGMSVVTIVTVVAVVAGRAAGGPAGRTKLKRRAIRERGRHVADRDYEIADDGYERGSQR